MSVHGDCSLMTSKDDCCRSGRLNQTASAINQSTMRADISPWWDTERNFGCIVRESALERGREELICARNPLRPDGRIQRCLLQVGGVKPNRVGNDAVHDADNTHIDIHIYIYMFDKNNVTYLRGGTQSISSIQYAGQHFSVCQPRIHTHSLDCSTTKIT